jgi:hypothetical protein
MPLVRKDRDPFERQPQPVTVRLEGDKLDVEFWLLRLATAAEYKGDSTVMQRKNSFFVIYPRAVND